MSRAQLRFLPLTNGLSSSSWEPEVSEGDPEDREAFGSGPSSAAAGTVSRGGFFTGGFSIQPAFLLKVVGPQTWVKLRPLFYSSRP